MSRKFSQEYVESIFKEYGCILLDEYINTKSKIKYQCKCGNISIITFDNFKRKSHCCNKCAQEIVKNKLKLPIEKVRQEFINRNCIPLFEEYINYATPLKYQCSCGNISYIRLGDLKRGKKCKNCCRERANKTLMENNNSFISKPQQFLYDLYGGELNFPVGNYLLDIAFPLENIYLEYDGSGHKLSIILQDITEEEFEKKEIKRNYFLYRRGWKEIRYINENKKDILPSKKDLIKIFDFCKEILKNNSYIKYNFQTCTFETKNCSYYFPFI